MPMLSGKEIMRQIDKGNIVISPFSESQVNPNSYNLTLGSELLIYTDRVLDAAKKNNTKTLTIPPEGITLLPDMLYIASTREYTETYGFVPQISGRSSIGRVGLYVHITAGLGANGYKGTWMLTLSCTVPVKIYAGMEVGQIYYFPIVGDDSLKYSGGYQGHKSASTSLVYNEFNENKKEVV